MSNELYDDASFTLPICITTFHTVLLHATNPLVFRYVERDGFTVSWLKTRLGLVSPRLRRR